MVMITHDIIRIGRCKLAVLSAGDTDGEPIALLHGILTSAELFRDVIRHLAGAGYRVYAPYLPGYGKTRLPDDYDYSLSTAADLFAIWLEQENIKPCWLVGHDLGGAIAQIMVVRYPHLISHLTLGDTVAADSFPVLSVKILQMLAAIGLYPSLVSMNLIPNPYTDWSLQRAFADPALLTYEAEERIFWDDKVDDPQGKQEFAKHLRDLSNIANVEIAPHLRNLTIPVLLLWAENDPYQPYDTVGEALRRLLRHRPDVTIIEDAGHFLPLEKPKAYADALIAWHTGLRLQTD